jgi:hypothetical protein
VHRLAVLRSESKPFERRSRILVGRGEQGRAGGIEHDRSEAHGAHRHAGHVASVDSGLRERVARRLGEVVPQPIDAHVQCEAGGTRHRIEVPAPARRGDDAAVGVEQQRATAAASDVPTEPTAAAHRSLMLGEDSPRQRARAASVALDLPVERRKVNHCGVLRVGADPRWR